MADLEADDRSGDGEPGRAQQRGDDGVGVVAGPLRLTKTPDREASSRRGSDERADPGRPPAAASAEQPADSGDHEGRDRERDCSADAPEDRLAEVEPAAVRAESKPERRADGDEAGGERLGSNP